MTADEHVSRDAGTGEFVSDKFAAEHPDTTVRETVEGVTSSEMLVAAAIMVGTLLDALPATRREWLDTCVAGQGRLFPGAARLQCASEMILRELDTPTSIAAHPDMSGTGKLNGLQEDCVMERRAALPSYLVDDEAPDA